MEGIYKMIWSKMTFLILFLFTAFFASSQVLSAEKQNEIFDREEIILSTIEENPTHFRIQRYKYFYYVGDRKQGPIQRSSVEMQGSCEGAGVERARGKGDVIGWTTADEKLIPPYNHKISVGMRAYHRIDLSKLEYEWHYLGHLNWSGNFLHAAEHPFGKSSSSNKKILQLKIVDEDWDTYFAKVLYRIC